ncbi:hypothetical protein BDV95DRAFT_592701 [Massariosphaeria phaeospora]|uniref:Zn(2)-C6 fungal-type domain-containing protein n=1 Tax=Massariosphaeria phaeospora TaxID=100035 RepID=A0A7C8I8G7_9PLEO|nr:hypothetical protein BDV95DRAFT_592701 [Massariosphaeria phaeospora]
MAGTEVSSRSSKSPKNIEKTGQDNKPKRVRSGCLTCRERHLKCDETSPICNNCRKSNRDCKRGLRLNYIDNKTNPDFKMAPQTAEWQVAFQDESRQIAGEYVGGTDKYPPLVNDPTPTDGSTFFMESSIHAPVAASHDALPSMQVLLPEPYEAQQNFTQEHSRAPSHHHTHSHTESAYSGSNIVTNSTGYSIDQSGPTTNARDYLSTQEEVLFMQVFVEEVGIWMDSMDQEKHFSRLLPFHALSEPMLLNAFLACGARHLALVNPKYSEDKALGYYDTATRFLLDSLQNPNRDTVLCATTAVILNVYEIMCERALQRMNHIAGARALIKECGWNARSHGIGAACFWLNVGMELLSCLHFNWQVAWDPDDWGLDMNFERETESGKEETWTHRIVYIVAKVANFRATIPRSPDAARHTLENRYREWERLKDLADHWNECIPRTMHPMAYLYPGSTLSGSAFPEVWLIKRASIVARLFYHTCMCLLAQINPLLSPDEPEMRTMLEQHSKLICGISAHVKDRGVASVALRSLAIAAECLTSRVEQEEVLEIFAKIRQETGWRVGFLNNELKSKWGWEAQPQIPEQSAAPSQAQNGNVVYQQQTQQQQQQQPQQIVLQQVIPSTAPPAAPPRQRPPPGILNPLLATADFTMEKHPYQSYYVAPNTMPNPPQQSLNGGFY